MARTTARGENGTDLDELIPDLPQGPLDQYRMKATFNWKEMKAHMDPPSIIALMVW